MGKGKRKAGKNRLGSVRAKAGLPAKAGRRKLPNSAGPHITSKEARDRARRLHNLGLRT